jgi:isoquinoline 1-oxidoreductase beta subunit
MEPMNATAHVTADRCEIWVPTQNATGAQETAAALTGLAPERVIVHTTYLGGGFGRRAEQDFVAEAVEIAKIVRAPVQVVWSRADDMQHDFYRPATCNVLKAGVTGGELRAWTHRIVGPAILGRVAPRAIQDGIDPTSLEGAWHLPYAIENLEVSYTLHDPGIPVGWWRSVGSSQNAFVTECFLDEVAVAAGRDPLEFRCALLAGAPRHRAVLELAAAKGDWGAPLPAGRGRGLAVHESFGSIVAACIEVAVTGGAVRVVRATCAVDCGTVVHPAIVTAQMESGLLFGLCAALKQEIRIEKGRVVQSSFDDYPLLALDEAPAVAVHLAPSGAELGGIGEPGVPPAAPALVNAIFAATGKRVRRLPVRSTDLG